MPSLISLPVKIARTAAKVPVKLARFGIERIFGGEEETTATPAATPAAKAAPRADDQSRTAPARARPVPAPAPAPKPAAKQASEAKKAAAKAPEPAPAEIRTEADLAPEPTHVDREAVEVMSVGPAQDVGAEITIDPAVLKLAREL